MLEKVALERSSKSTKYELEGYYGDPVHEQFSFLKTAKLQRECYEDIYTCKNKDQQNKNISLNNHEHEENINFNNCSKLV